MDIVILADFCGDFSISDNGRFLYIAEMLAKENSVEIITSDFQHENKAKLCPDEITRNYKLTMLHEAPYTKNVCLKRVFAHIGWARRVREYLEKRNKPDVIYCAVPPLKAAVEAAEYCKINNVKFVIDIQDLWPEAFKMVLNVPILSDIFFAPMNNMANFIYAQADKVIAVSETYCQRALKVNNKCKDAITVFLGTNLDDFDENVRNNQPKIEKSKNEVWLAYCGTLGHSYDITCVIDALAMLKNEGIRVPKFIVMGDGPRLDEFKNYAVERNVDAIFTGRLPYPEMCGLLASCDIAVNPIVKGAAQSIINKHGDYAAAGIPVLNTQECKEYRNLVEQYNMGYNCKNDDARDLAEKMKILLSNQDLRISMGKNSRLCANEKFNRAYSYNNIIDIF